MATSATVLRVNDLRPAQVSAIKRKAQRMGLTPETYLKELICNDLELDYKAKNTPLHKLAAPFHRALGDISGEELDRRINIARTRRRRHSSSRKY